MDLQTLADRIEINDLLTRYAHAVDSKDFKPVVDACTLCDMCFMTKCPYVPPHEFNLDFPHLMLRYRAAELRQGQLPAMEQQLTETDRNGKLGSALAPLTNWATRTQNGLTRPIMEKVAHVDRNAALPTFNRKTLLRHARGEKSEANRQAPAYGRKAVIYATCYGNYNLPSIGLAARAVLAKNGVETEVLYPGCCGMPQLEHGDLARVAEKARQVSAELSPWIDKGYDVTINHPGLTAWSVPVLDRIAGEGNVGVVDKICGSEDFSCYQQKVPGFFYFVGCTPPDKDAATAAPNHSPRFFVDEGCLKVGVKTLAGLAVDWLAANPK